MKIIYAKRIPSGQMFARNGNAVRQNKNNFCDFT
jgi:hypothetical protein